MLKLAEQMINGNLIKNTFTFSFRKGGHKGEIYSATSILPTFAYKNDSNSVVLHISNVENPAFSYLVGLDVEKGAANPLAKSCLLDRNFTKAFVAELGAEDWVILQGLNLATRTRISEEFTDFASLEVDFTEHVAMIEQENLTLSYREIFKYSASPEIIYKGEKYALDEQYIISHTQDYRNCLLVFMVLENERFLDASNPKTRQAWYFYDTQTLESTDCRVGVDAAFFAEVKKQLPDLASLVKKRHASLRLVYENYCKRESLHFSAPKALPSSSVSSVQGTEDLKYMLLPKIGRNDPCPCGSGKKYKKCCML